MTSPYRDPDHKKVTICLGNIAHKRLVEMADANGMTEAALVEWVTREYVWDNYSKMESKIKANKKFVRLGAKLEI